MKRGMLSNAARKPCCYVVRDKLVYAVLIEDEDDDEIQLQATLTTSSADDRVNTSSVCGQTPSEISSPSVLVSSRAYHSSKADHTRLLHTTVVVLETPIMAPPPVIAEWQPLHAGDLVVGITLKRHAFGAEHDALEMDWSSFLKKASSLHEGESLDPYDSTIPPHMSLHLELLRVTRVGPLDVIRVVSVGDLNEAIDQFTHPPSPTGDHPSTSSIPVGVSPHGGTYCFKRSEVRKVVDYRPHSMMPQKRKEHTSDRMRRLLHEKLLVGTTTTTTTATQNGATSAESQMVQELKSANLRVAQAGVGIGHSTHSVAKTIEDLIAL